MGERNTAQLIAYAVAAILLVAGGVRYLGGGDDEGAPPPVAIDGAGAAADEAADGSPGETAPGSSTELQVHVAGAVRKEGLYRLPAGSRVEAAVHEAGGLKPTAELTGVNLAAELQDGQQVIVPKRGAAAATPTSSSSGAASAASAAGASAGPGGQPGAPISLASATVEQLDAGVDGIGPTLAARIIEYRDQNGGFKSVDELAQVEGIGEARLAALREAVTP